MIFSSLSRKNVDDRSVYQDTWFLCSSLQIEVLASSSVSLIHMVS